MYLLNIKLTKGFLKAILHCTILIPFAELNNPCKMKSTSSYARNALLVVALSAISFIELNAQFYDQTRNDTNFYEIRDSFYQGFTGNGDTSESGPFNQFRRWEQFWGPRVAPSGSFIIAHQAIANYVNVNSTPPTSLLVQPSWSELGPSRNGMQGIGRMSALEFDPYNSNIMYAGAPVGGVWKTTDGGQNWINLNTDLQLPRLGITSIQIDPNSPDQNNPIIYAGTGDWGSDFSFSDGVYRSIDGGSTWTAMNSGLFNASAFCHIGKLLIDPTNSTTMFVATSKGIYVTHNRQALVPTWQKVYPIIGNQSVRMIQFEPGNTQTIYACGINVVRSTSGGGFGTWNPIATPTTNFDLVNTPTANAFPSEYIMGMNMAIAPDNTCLYVQVLTATSAPPFTWQTTTRYHFMRYDIGSGMWQERNSIYYTPPPASGIYSASRLPNFEVSPVNSDELFLGNVWTYGTTDGGFTWNQLGVAHHADVHVLRYDPQSSNDIFICCDGGIWTGDIQALTSVELNNGLGVSTMYNLSSASKDPYQVLTGSQDCGTNYLKNNIWTHEITSDGFETVIDFYAPQNMYATDYSPSNGSLHRSVSSVTNPNFNATINTTLEGAIFGAPLVMDPRDPNTLYQGRLNVWKSTNASAVPASSVSWMAISSFSQDFGYNQAITVLAVAPTDPNYIYVVLYGDPSNGTPHRLMVTEDGGTTWYDRTPNPANGYVMTGISVSGSDPRNLWVCHSGYGGPKVIKSNNAGMAGSWSNETTAGLPDLPINCIVYQNGSNDAVYVGTDMGVYYKDATMGQWNVFGFGFPNTVVRQLEINYCGGKIRAATYGRGAWEADLPVPPISGTPAPLTSSTTWTTPMKLDYDLIIPTGMTLTIKNTVNIGKDRKIIVDRGGKLIIDGGILTNECGNMWHGIEVAGTRTAPQLPLSSQAQGHLVLISGAVIENAYEAISVFRTDLSGNIDWNSTGGIISASNSTFRNCVKAVDFLSYRYLNQSNSSYFKGCTFETNGLLNDPSATPYAFVSMFDVKGVKFLGCTFRNATPNLYTVDRRGTGILAMDAGIYLDNYCTSLVSPCPTSGVVHNRFENLAYGIDVGDATPFSSVKVNDCDFFNNNRGAIFRGMDFSVITNNRFDVGQLEIVNAAQYLPYGLYLEYCTGYQVEGNSFTTSIIGNTSSVGMAIYHSGPQFNIVYNNIFDNLQVGTLVMENNDGSSLGDGLQVKCNDYGLNTQDVYDIAITEFGTVDEYQGADVSQTSPAGNVFSHSCGSGDNDYSAPTTPSNIVYTHHTDAIATPQCYSATTTTLNSSTFTYISKAVSCPTSFANCSTPCLRSNIAYNMERAQELTLLIDGNNTQELLSAISTGNPSQVQVALLDASPYLSDEVLLTALNANLPPAIIKNIILANSPVSMEVSQELANISLPVGILNQIEAAQKGVSERSKLEAKIAYYYSERESNINQLIRVFLTDTTYIDGEDSVKAILKGENRVEDKCKLAALYLKTGDYTSAIELLDSLELAGHSDNFCTLQQYIIELHQHLNSCFYLSTATAMHQDIEDVANDQVDKSGCANAQVLLKLVFSQHFPEVIILPTLSSARTSLEPAFSRSARFDLFPNPSDGSSFKVVLADSMQSGTFEIHDILGNSIIIVPIVPGKMEYSIEGNELAAGMYLCTLFKDGELSESQKLIISK